jgi:leucokinin receptor
MLFLVVSLFLICWFPLQLYNYLNVNKPEINEYILSINQIKISQGFCFCDSFKHIVVLWLCANWLAMSNSCHNPFIYGLCSVSFFFVYLFI